MKAATIGATMYGSRIASEGANASLWTQLQQVGERAAASPYGPARFGP